MQQSILKALANKVLKRNQLCNAHATKAKALCNFTPDLDHQKIHDANIQEHLDERAAIMEFDGGLTRDQAESEARKTLRIYEYRLKGCKNWMVKISPGCSLEEARKSCELTFGVLFKEIRPYRRAEI